MNDRLVPFRAHLRLARQTLERHVAVLQAGGTPAPEWVVEAIAELDDALRELDALARPAPLRVLPGGRGRDGC